MASNPGKIVKALFAFQQAFSAAKKKLREQEFTGASADVSVSMDGRGNVLAIAIPGATEETLAALLESFRQANATREVAAESVLRNVNIQEIPWLGKLLKE